MLKIHHLVLSRSERIVWLAEELGLPYEMVRHDRDPVTFRAPAALKAFSPMAKFPSIQDGDLTLAESGAIIEYILNRYGQGRLRPALDSKEYPTYLHWMHAAESTLMLPVLFELLGAMCQVNAPMMDGFTQGEYQTVLGYLNEVLSKQDYVAGAQFTAADIMVGYTLALANGSAIPAMKSKLDFNTWPAIVAYLKRLEQRPAFVKSKQLCAA